MVTLKNRIFSETTIQICHKKLCRKGWAIMKGQWILKGIFTAASIAAMTLAAMPTTVSAESSRFSSTTSRTENGDICINFEEVEVILPSDWAGLCRMVTSSDQVTFYHVQSQDSYRQEGIEGSGWLFAIHFTSNPDFSGYPNDFLTIGETAEGFYYTTSPSDVQAYVNDQAIASEYFSLFEDVDWIQENISLVYYEEGGDSWTEETLSDEYIFPQSADSYLTSEDLSGMSADDIQMAINEIYARHNRKFVMKEVQEYFDSKSWYEGTVEADDFDISVMNTYEGANINLMVTALKKATGQNAAAASDTSSQSTAVSDQNGSAQSGSTKDAYGMIIESGNDYFRIRQEDGSTIQFWYDHSRLEDMGITSDELEVGAITSLIYDSESYEAVSILVW